MNLPLMPAEVLKPKGRRPKGFNVLDAVAINERPEILALTAQGYFNTEDSMK